MTPKQSEKKLMMDDKTKSWAERLEEVEAPPLETPPPRSRWAALDDEEPAVEPEPQVTDVAPTVTGAGATPETDADENWLSIPQLQERLRAQGVSVPEDLQRFRERIYALTKAGLFPKAVPRPGVGAHSGVSGRYPDATLDRLARFFIAEAEVKRAKRDLAGVRAELAKLAKTLAATPDR